MKRIVLSVLVITFLGLAAKAQSTDKIVLTKGQKVNVATTMKSDIEQAQRGKMTSDMTVSSELVVKEITESGYLLEATMKKVKMSFEGFGMKQDYDSEDKDAKPGMIAKSFDKVLNKAEELKMGFDGKVVEVEEKKKEGMMAMMRGGDAKSAVEGMFLLLPKDIEVGKKWRTTKEKDGLKVITEYTYRGKAGSMARLTANQQSKGEIAGGRGGQFTTKVNQLTQMKIMVDPKTGLISMKESTTKDSSSTEMGGETYDSKGTIVSTVTCE